MIDLITRARAALGRQEGSIAVYRGLVGELLAEHEADQALVEESIRRWEELHAGADKLCAYCQAPFTIEEIAGHVRACEHNPMVAELAELRGERKRVAGLAAAWRRRVVDLRAEAAADPSREPAIAITWLEWAAGEIAPGVQP